MSRARVNRKNRIVFSLVGIGALAFSALLAMIAFEDAIVFFYTPSELAQKNIPADQLFRLGGLVAVDSYKELSQEKHFIIDDGGAQLAVIYQGILPDLFREGQGVVALGRLNNNIFYAQEILAKHDENYMPKEVADKLKENGYWQH